MVQNSNLAVQRSYPPTELNTPDSSDGDDVVESGITTVQMPRPLPEPPPLSQAQHARNCNLIATNACNGQAARQPSVASDIPIAAAPQPDNFSVVAILPISQRPMRR